MSYVDIYTYKEDCANHGARREAVVGGALKLYPSTFGDPPALDQRSSVSLARARDARE